MPVCELWHCLQAELVRPVFEFVRYLEMTKDTLCCRIRVVRQ